MKLIESFNCVTYLYNSVDEKIKHKAVMINNGWEIDGESFGETISIIYCMYLLQEELK